MDRTPGRRDDDLSPTPFDRIGHLIRPAWARTPVVRRVAAGALTLLALALAVRGDPGDDREPVVTVTRDLAPGSVLGAEDVRTTHLASSAVPAGSVHTVDDALGHTLAGPARSGEILTDVRLLGSRLAGAAAGPDARIVPLRIDDTEVAALLRVGDRVDILAVDGEHSAEPRVLASAATVVLVSPGEDGRTRRGPVVLAALPENAATAVAAASLTGALTVTFH
ncbi:SAF domain-containing protein [Rhodococcus olei]